MGTHNLIQGTREWHEHRATHFNASDAPAMMGVSPYQTRTELLHQRSTGITPDVDEATQRRLDDGHRFEALARTLAEQIIGEDLYPVTVSTGRYSASMDGLNMAEDESFEHKSLNDSIRAATCAQDLPEYLRVQMEHQFIASPRTVRCLFMASKWGNEGNLLEEKRFWYEPDLDLRARIIAGWEQFEKDLADYVPVIHAEKPQAEVSIQLPALFIHAQGAITSSNMEEYGRALALKLAEVRAIVLATDQDFSNAKESAKLFREQCKKLELAKEAMLSQTVTIGEAARMMDAWHEDLRITALKLEKDVEREDLTKKRTMVSGAHSLYLDYVNALYAETKPIELNVPRPDFAGEIKGKRSYASMQDALDTALANAKIQADAIAKDIRTKLAWHKENAEGYEFLFADMQQIVYKPADDFQMLVKNRIDQHKAEEKVRIERLAEQLAAQAIVGQPAPALVAPSAPPDEAPKPAAAKSSGSVNRDVPSRVDPLILTLARRDPDAFRTKFSDLKSATLVNAAIDSFLAATAPQGTRETVEA